MVKAAPRPAADPPPLDSSGHQRSFVMFRLVMIAGVFSLLAACSTSPGYGTKAMGASGTAQTNPPRSPGEGPSINPYYGGSTTR
jgi:hypothetical protein